MNDYEDRSRLYKLEVEFYLTDKEYDRIVQDPAKFSKFLINRIKHDNPTIKEV